MAKRKTNGNGNGTIIEEKNIPLNNKQTAEVLYSKKLNLKCKNRKQKEYINAIDQNAITICIGPAGTGKSHVAFYKALHLLINPDNQYQKIFLLTPPVEVGTRLGFLPGDLAEKMSHYTYSMYYLIDRLIGKENRIKLTEQGIIELLGIGFLRGTNIDNAILITDEAQNMSIKEFKTLVTRIGFNSKFIISGDIEQIDKFKNKGESGLYDFFQKIKRTNVNSVSPFEFTNEDIVRNPLITELLELYNKEDILKVGKNGKGEIEAISECELIGLA